MATAENKASATPLQNPYRPDGEVDPEVELILAERRRRFTVDEYYKMAEVGILKEGERVELIDGDIVLKSDRTFVADGDEITVSPTGSPHASCVRCLQYLLSSSLGPRAIISVQSPVRLNNRAEPEPDLAVLRPRGDNYRGAHPGPEDIFLIIEVMASSAAADRKVKLGRYARSGVAEVWLVDLNRELIEVHRRPAGKTYSETRKTARGESLAPEAFPDVVIAVDAVLG